jgi:hypothetical protein
VLRFLCSVLIYTWVLGRQMVTDASLGVSKLVLSYVPIKGLQFSAIESYR